jgi:hypothetical protein
MHFLVKPIESFNLSPVMLKKTKYNYRIKFLQDKDRDHINHILKRIHPELKIQESDMYVNGKDTIFKSESYPGIPISFDETLKWKIQVVFQGYKYGSGPRPTPIWKIKEAQVYVQ